MHKRGDEQGLTKRQKLPPGTVARSRQLRREATPPERLLWRALRERLPAAKFRHQVPLGPYYADFCSHAAKLVVEADGGQHADAQPYDEARTRFITDEGYRVLRFWNNEITDNLDGVLAAIAEAVDSPSPSQA